MKYDDALKAWGILKLTEFRKVDIDPDTVTVSMFFDEGYSCCGGTNEGCYCSYAYGPSAEVRVQGYEKGTYYPVRWDLPYDSFDFSTVLKEICEAANGAVTLD